MLYNHKFAQGMLLKEVITQGSLERLQPLSQSLSTVTTLGKPVIQTL
ncbi:protein of unknown function [Limnospira indica PCC 8005]|uniref:Uncharacterized protein n=1 Tax=Limnospira indica PCC 8005 TaxID=376219 RepID=A0A9P1KGE5_9CYAN|nr:protein of unknown function [Limnospira indica PCC 8005]